MSPLDILTSKMGFLTNKASIIGRFVMDSPHQVPHLSSRKLAAACGTSESSVIRFARQLGYPGYVEFQTALETCLKGRKTRPFEITKGHAPPFLEDQLVRSYTAMHEFIHTLDMKVFRQLVTLIFQSRKVYIAGEGPTFHFAAQMGWEISQLRSGVRFFHIRDREFETELLEAPKGTCVVFISGRTCSRDMVRACRTASALDLWVAAIASHLPCPLADFSYLMLTHGNPQDSSKPNPLNLNFMISCICRMARDEELALAEGTGLAPIPGGNDDPEDQALRIGMWAAPASLDPAFAAGTRREWPVISCLFNGLVKYKEGSWDIVPDLAASWTMSKDQMTQIFYLRKGVEFHRDYGELTAEDVKFSLERASQGYFKSVMAFLERVDVIDRYTVALVLREPSAHLFPSILPFIPGKIVSKRAMEELGSVRFAFNPVGSGPYQFEAHSAGDRIRLERFHRYWDRQPEMKALEFIPLKEKQIQTRFKSGRIHITRLPFIHFDHIRELPNVAYDVNHGLDHWMIGFNVNREPFSDIRVRRAVRRALDVDAILRRAFGGVPERSFAPIPAGAVGYWADAPRRRRDTERARTEIREALGDREIRANLLIMPSESDRIAGEIIRDNLAELGIQVSFTVRNSEIFNDAAAQGDFDLYFTFCACPIDPAMTLNWFCSKEPWNCSHWSHREFDRTIDRANRQINPDKRQALLIRAQELMDEECVVVWVTNGSGVVLRQRHIDPGKLFPDGSLAPWLIRRK